VTSQVLKPSWAKLFRINTARLSCRLDSLRKRHMHGLRCLLSVDATARGQNRSGSANGLCCNNFERQGCADVRIRHPRFTRCRYGNVGVKRAGSGAIPVPSGEFVRSESILSITLLRSDRPLNPV
jgi:hypothetical protein